jgi:hypothetical protein
MFDFFVFLSFCCLMGNPLHKERECCSNLGKVSRALAFFPLAMQEWCILSILVMGENHPLDHRPHLQQGNVP